MFSLLRRYTLGRNIKIRITFRLCLLICSLENTHSYICLFDVCGSVHLGNICFIQIQLNVQYSFFAKFLALHVASIIRSTIIVYINRFFFMVLVCLVHGAGTGVGTFCQSVPTQVLAPWNKHTKTILKNRWLYTAVVLLMMDANNV
jgi:hypothetical protein